MRILNAHQQI
jgi:hypothetical protein